MIIANKLSKAIKEAEEAGNTKLVMELKAKLKEVNAEKKGLTEANKSKVNFNEFKDAQEKVIENNALVEAEKTKQLEIQLRFDSETRKAEAEARKASLEVEKMKETHKHAYDLEKLKIANPGYYKPEKKEDKKKKKTPSLDISVNGLIGLGLVLGTFIFIFLVAKFG